MEEIAALKQVRQPGRWTFGEDREAHIRHFGFLLQDGAQSFPAEARFRLLGEGQVDFIGAIENREKLVELPLRYRVVGVVVTLSTAEREPEPDRGRGRGSVHDRFDAILLLV